MTTTNKPRTSRISSAIYSYGAVAGLERHVIIDRGSQSVTVARGITGELIRRSIIDTPPGTYPNGHYFTTPSAAIEAYIARGEAALADKTRNLTRGHIFGWKRAIADARTRLAALKPTRKARKA